MKRKAIEKALLATAIGPNEQTGTGPRTPEEQAVAGRIEMFFGNVPSLFVPFKPMSLRVRCRRGIASGVRRGRGVDAQTRCLGVAADCPGVVAWSRFRNVSEVVEQECAGQLAEWRDVGTGASLRHFRGREADSGLGSLCPPDVAD